MGITFTREELLLILHSFIMKNEELKEEINKSPNGKELKKLLKIQNNLIIKVYSGLKKIDVLEED